MDVIWMGFSASLVAGLFSGVGALGVFFITRLSMPLLDRPVLEKPEVWLMPSWSE